MGQYGNQPDFGTRALTIVPLGVAELPLLEQQLLNSAALYIGTGGNLLVTVVGGDNAGYEGQDNVTLFKNIPNGTFFPVIVNNVWLRAVDGGDELTTCSDIVALY
jgi:hypothetical protein